MNLRDIVFCQFISEEVKEIRFSLKSIIFLNLQRIAKVVKEEIIFLTSLRSLIVLIIE